MVVERGLNSKQEILYAEASWEFEVGWDNEAWYVSGTSIRRAQ